LFAVIGVLAALAHREKTGQGQHIDVSLLGALTSLVAIEPFDAMRRVGMKVRTGRTMSRLAPFGVFAARDGEVAICAPTDTFALALFGAMGDPELTGEARFATRQERVAHADEVHARVAAWVRERSGAEVVELLTAAGVPAAEVRDPAEAVTDPRVMFRGETAPLSHPTRGPVEGVQGSGVPIRFSESRAGYDRPAPFLGEHNHHVYGELCGYTEDELKAMARDGVV
jgi:crotonobetainyl-CoA:carnitine CoA-transferase CaiB-like acyl-CoA transferase